VDDASRFAFRLFVVRSKRASDVAPCSHQSRDELLAHFCAQIRIRRTPELAANNDVAPVGSEELHAVGRGKKRSAGRNYV
jgi:hypothetical protein